MKNLIKILLCAILSASLFAGCSERSPSSQSDGRLQIVSTIFPSYDFARAIAGENADVSILLAPGVESHSYEPTPQDIIRIQNCDLFLYTGGESDTWVDDLLASFDEPVNTVKMMDCVEVYEEELLEGMQTEESTGTQETEYDEHVWTSPKNAILISRAIEKNLCDIDPENAASYQENASAYIAQLEMLDKTSVISSPVFPTKQWSSAIVFLSAILRKNTGWTALPPFPDAAVRQNPASQPSPF